MENSPLALFEHEKFGSLRVVRSEQGDPWFVGKDVCVCLEIGNSRHAVASLDDDEKGVGIIDTPGGKQEMSIVSEPGLYSLILRSRKPEAKAFKRWVTHDILPSIRRSGGYVMAKPDDTPEAILARAVLVAQDTIRRIEAERDEAIRTKAQIGIRREALTGLPISGILNFPNRTGVTVALAWPHQAVKSGLFCSCHRYTSSGCGHILARRRPGVREAPAAVRAGERRLAFFCAQNPKSY